jgi:dihydrofolate synthase/folylpolyglutamate synthase
MILNYQETLDWMFSRLPMYQRQGSIAFKKDLTNSIAFSERLGQPEKQFPSVHVAGTNGKGSTSHMIASILQSAGYKVGLYTSPHLKDFRERININGNPIPQKDVIRFIELHKAFLETQKLSFFELTVGMAFDHFARQKVDIAIVEVGLGGRLDSTNIIQPIISVITNIGFDHMQFLGDTLPEIAAEKAGIIKPKTPVVIGETQNEVASVFTTIAQKLQAPIYFADQQSTKLYESDLKGEYQLKNIKTVLQTIKLLIDMDYVVGEEALQEGIKNVSRNTGLKGRWQLLNSRPKTICDTAHNQDGLSLVMKQLGKETYRTLHIVLGVVNDKDLKSVLTLFPKTAQYYFCKPDIPRGLDANVLMKEAKTYGLVGNVYESVDAAYKQAIQNADEDDLIFIGGSTFVVAEMPL